MLSLIKTPAFFAASIATNKMPSNSAALGRSGSIVTAKLCDFLVNLFALHDNEWIRELKLLENPVILAINPKMTKNLMAVDTMINLVSCNSSLTSVVKL